MHCWIHFTPFSSPQCIKTDILLSGINSIIKQIIYFQFISMHLFVFVLFCLFVCLFIKTFHLFAEYHKKLFSCVQITHAKGYLNIPNFQDTSLSEHANTINQQMKWNILLLPGVLIHWSISSMVCSHHITQLVAVCIVHARSYILFTGASLSNAPV